jgi:heme/copper-type cytochrome/quinol oxidase subunit 3
MRAVQTAREIPRGTVSNAAFGMALFVFVEVMLFAGFISAFGIVRANALPGAWPPPGQPRLPVARTALNTVALLLSGAALFVAGRRFRGPRPESARGWMAAALLLGAFFYTIVGAHALHAVVALVVLALVWRAMREGQLTESRFGAARIFWYFVVLVWPLLYWRVYL